MEVLDTYFKRLVSKGAKDLLEHGDWGVSAAMYTGLGTSVPSGVSRLL